MFACCLEDARFEAAEEAFAALVHTFFDWNEIRVTSLSELSEVMTGLPDPRVAGNRIKRILHGIFETSYSFDLEERKKKNLGSTVKWLESVEGTTAFTVAYLIQSALGGHQIPIDTGTMATLRILDLVTDKDVADGVVPGLGAGDCQVEGDRVRLVAAPTWRGFYGQPVFAGGARAAAADRAHCEGTIPPASRSKEAAAADALITPKTRQRENRRRGNPRRQNRLRKSPPMQKRQPARRRRHWQAEENLRQGRGRRSSGGRWRRGWREGVAGRQAIAARRRRDGRRTTG